MVSEWTMPASCLPSAKSRSRSTFIRDCSSAVRSTDETRRSATTHGPASASGAHAGGAQLAGTTRGGQAAAWRAHHLSPRERLPRDTQPPPSRPGPASRAARICSVRRRRCCQRARAQTMARRGAMTRARLAPPRPARRSATRRRARRAERTRLPSSGRAPPERGAVPARRTPLRRRRLERGSRQPLSDHPRGAPLPPSPSALPLFTGAENLSEGRNTANSVRWLNRCSYKGSSCAELSPRMPYQCPVCAAACDKRCKGCLSVAYCSVEHQVGRVRACGRVGVRACGRAGLRVQSVSHSRTRRTHTPARTPARRPPACAHARAAGGLEAAQGRVQGARRRRGCRCARRARPGGERGVRGAGAHGGQRAGAL